MITAVSTTALHAGRESCGLPCAKQALGSGFSPETASVCVHVSGRLGWNIHAGERPMLLLNNYINLMSQV